MKKNAFTLAEVLITMSILGVVAALTMPSLHSDVQKKGFESRLQKAHSTVTNAVSLYMVDEGMDKLDSGVLAGQDNRNMISFLRKYFRVVQDCKNAPYSANGAKCFASRYSSIDSSKTATLADCTGRAVLLQDGVAMCWTKTDEDLVYDLEALEQEAQTTGELVELYKALNKYQEFGAPSSYYKVIVDINGPKKPNIAGRDLFVMHILTNGQVADLTWNAANSSKDLKAQKASANPMPIGRFLTNDWTMDY